MSGPGPLLSVAEARARLVAAFATLPAETVPLPDAFGRVLAQDLAALRTQPPAAMSAMDGYAVRYTDVATAPAALTVIGRAPAGGVFDGAVGSGQAVRIFTGAPLPDGADTVVIQENVAADGERIAVNVAAARQGHHVRPAGADFRQGDVGLPAGRRLTARDIALAAAMGHGWIAVRRRPRIAILATGDELKRPGEALGPGQIVASNSFGLAAMVTAAGGIPIDLGIAPDREDALAEIAAGARGADLLVTIGGASVGDHDLIHKVLGRGGATIDFWKIAIRPGKPLMFGRVCDGTVPLLGLPGNPVSAIVCGLLYLLPAMAGLLGATDDGVRQATAVLGADMPANDSRQDYVRATLDGDIATPARSQDSSLLSVMAQAGCLILRPPHAPPAPAGTTVPVILLDGGMI